MGLVLASLHIALLSIAASIFVATAVSDACTYRIPNYLCGLLLLLFPCFVATNPYPIDWHQNLMIFALVGLSGFAMFLGHLVGAGDVKFLAVSSLWAGAHYLAILLIVTAIAGGLLSLVMAFIVHRRQSSEGAHTSLSHVPIPYGIAIATGGLAMLGMIASPILFPS